MRSVCNSCDYPGVEHCEDRAGVSRGVFTPAVTVLAGRKETLIVLCALTYQLLWGNGKKRRTERKQRGANGRQSFSDETVLEDSGETALWREGLPGKREDHRSDSQHSEDGRRGSCMSSQHSGGVDRDGVPRQAASLG